MEREGGGGAGRLVVSWVACARVRVLAHSRSKVTSRSSNRLARRTRGSVSFISESAFLLLRIRDALHPFDDFAVDPAEQPHPHHHRQQIAFRVYRPPLRVALAPSIILPAS